MASATEMLVSVEDQVLETTRQWQDAVVKAVQTWAEASKNVIPELPVMPFADQFPAPTDLVENAFHFADRLMAAQRDFASAVLDAARPVLKGTKEATEAGEERSKQAAKAPGKTARTVAPAQQLPVRRSSQPETK